MAVYFSVLVVSFICIVKTAPQNPEINDQFNESNSTNVSTVKNEGNTTKTNMTNLIDEIKVAQPKTEVNSQVNTAVAIDVIKVEHKSFTAKLYDAITCPIVRLISVPKVNRVVRNIGTCIVNGAMELISFYFPAPLIPLIASAAGLFIPFEPVVMLKEKMPVTSYRRAFRTAVDSFMGTFDNYKVHDDEDPYMTNRFNRRFMGNSKEIKGQGKGQNEK